MRDEEDDTPEPSDDDRDGNEAPETPLDEPAPPRIQDPPPEPTRKGPYVTSWQPAHDIVE